MIRGLAALGLTVSLAACSESLNLDAAGQLDMTMQRAGSSLFAPASDQGSASSTRAVSPDTVSAFIVTVTSIEVQHSASDSANGGAWTTVHLASPVRINLMTYGTGDDSARAFARGNVEAGDYVRVRLTLANPSIRFKGDLSFGVGSTLQGNTDYAIELPQNGTIEMAADAQVDANTSDSIHLVFNPGASLGTVSLSGTGEVLLSAVINAR
jgi:hypothetical protein